MQQRDGRVCWQPRRSAGRRKPAVAHLECLKLLDAEIRENRGIRGTKACPYILCELLDHHEHLHALNRASLECMESTIRLQIGRKNVRARFAQRPRVSGRRRAFATTYLFCAFEEALHTDTDRIRALAPDVAEGKARGETHAFRLVACRRDELPHDVLNAQL